VIENRKYSYKKWSLYQFSENIFSHSYFYGIYFAPKCSFACERNRAYKYRLYFLDMNTTRAAKNYILESYTASSKSLNDLVNAYKRYDKIFFDGKISDQLDVGLIFRKTNDPDAIIWPEKEKVYYMNVSAKTFQEDPLTTMDMLERAIVQLIVLAWGIKSNFEISECVRKEFFGGDDNGMGMGFGFGFGFVNWSNSCYIDSVVMVLFGCLSPFWRETITETNLSKVYHPPTISADGSGCSSEKLMSLANQFQNQFALDLSDLRAGEYGKKCTRLRSLLAECTEGVKIKGRWPMFNAGAIYDSIVDLIPTLKTPVPSQIHRVSGGPDPVKYISESTLTMWDFMDPLDDVDGDYKEIRWDLIDSDVLVFVNGGTPRIKKLGSIEPESGYNYIGTDKYKFQVNKARKFDYYILGGKYELVGAVMLHGVSPSKEGGAHYTCYFKRGETSPSRTLRSASSATLESARTSRSASSATRWYHYDDMSGRIESVDIEKEHIFEEIHYTQPAVYFYAKRLAPKDDVSRKSPLKPRKCSPTLPLHHKPTAEELEEAVLKNTVFRQIVWTDDNKQYVAMSIPKNIGWEIHPDTVQVFIIAKGRGYIIRNENSPGNSDMRLASRKLFTVGDVIQVEKGTWHDIEADPSAGELKLLTIYYPPHHAKNRCDIRRPAE